MRRVPTLGYPSRTDAALALAEKGYSRSQIAAKMGCTEDAISGLIDKHRKRCGTGKVRDWDRATHRVFLWKDDVERLRHHAKKRGTNISGLVRRLIQVIARDDMVDAVLDDDGAMLPKHKRMESTDASAPT